jgi:protein phosphatase
MTRIITYPAAALVILVGPSGSGKSTFAAKHFGPTQVISSDRCRAMIADSEASQAINEDAFALLHHWLELRLTHRRFTVVDSTALKPSARANLTALAAKHRVPCFALILDVPFEECLRRDTERTHRQVGERVIQKQYATFEQAKREIPRDAAFTRVDILSVSEMDDVRITRTETADNAARFDVIGDVHGCLAELHELFAELGYIRDAKGLPVHPDGRIPAFVGDLADRGPDSPGVLRLVVDMTAADKAVFAPGNHDDKLFRMLKGNKVTRSHGLDLTEQQLNDLPPAERAALTADILAHLATVKPYLVLDGGRLVVAHAGIKEEYIGRYDGQVRQFTLYGDVRGFEPSGKPIRYDWASEYRGAALICYGHTPQQTIRFVNNTINLDGGCVFGGTLNALRYPEREIVSVRAHHTYAEYDWPAPPEPEETAKIAANAVD